MPILMSGDAYDDNFNGSSFTYAPSNPQSKAFLVAQGNFGGGTVKAQYSLDSGTTWTDISGLSLTANGIVTAEIPQGLPVRVILTGATSPSVYIGLY